VDLNGWVGVGLGGTILIEILKNAKLYCNKILFYYHSRKSSLLWVSFLSFPTHNLPVLRSINKK